jgi:tRNA(Ile)-lysidine synthase
VIETFLMREIMGRGLRSLQGIAERQPFANGQLIRPLLKFEKSELTTPIFFEDVTNTGTDYFRNRVRNVLIPQLSEENPQFSEAIFGLSSEIDLAMQVISEKISDLEIVNEKIDLARFCEQSEAFQHFILQAYFAQFPELKITKAKFEELLHLIRRPQQFRGSLNKNVNFIKTKMEFYIEKNKKSALTDLSVTFENPQDDSYQVIYLPEHGEVEIRKRQPGDEILIKGHHKKLRKFFIEYQVPLEKRENPLIFVDNHLYAIVDVMCSDLSNSAKNDKMRRTLWAKAQSKRGN